MDIILSDVQELITPVPDSVTESEPIIALKRRTTRQLGHLDALESEAIHIMREVAAECTESSADCSQAVKTPSCCCDWRKKPFVQGVFHFRCCMSIPVIIFPK